MTIQQASQGQTLRCQRKRSHSSGKTSSGFCSGEPLAAALTQGLVRLIFESKFAEGEDERVRHLRGLGPRESRSVCSCSCSTQTSSFLPACLAPLLHVLKEQEHHQALRVSCDNSPCEALQGEARPQYAVLSSGYLLPLPVAGLALVLAPPLSQSVVVLIMQTFSRDGAVDDIIKALVKRMEKQNWAV